MVATKISALIFSTVMGKSGSRLNPICYRSMASRFVDNPVHVICRKIDKYDLRLSTGQ
jgi:hypothetical protein